MDTLILDFGKYGLEHIKNKGYGELTDADICKLTDAYSNELISPYIPDIELEMDNIQKLLSLSKCQKCGKCCKLNKKALDNPGIMVSEKDLDEISKNTKHSFKSLKKRTIVNEDSRYAVNGRYLKLPCMFLEIINNTCKIYSHRPFICRIYPVSFGDNGVITIDVQCEYGKKIYQKTLKYLRELDKQDKS